MANLAFDRRIFAQQSNGAKNQIAEIEHFVLRQIIFVKLVNAGGFERFFGFELQFFVLVRARFGEHCFA